MRIALAVTEFPSASQTFVLDHACGLIERGHEVRLHALKSGSLRQAHAGVTKFALLKRTHYAPPELVFASPLVRVSSFLRRAGTTLLRHPLLARQFMLRPSGNRLDVMRRCLSFWSRAKGYDLIHAHSGYNAQQLMPLYEASNLRTPLVVTFHGHDVHAFLRGRSENYYQTTFARAAALIVCSGFMRQRLLALGAPAEKLQVIPNAVSLDGVTFRERRVPQGGVLRLLTIGRLVSFKGLDVLIRALQQPSMLVLNWRLEIVGDGPLRAALTAQVQAAGLSDRIIFHGACSREIVLSIIDSSDLYLAPAVVDENGNTETQGVALLEAMASGLPVIASDVGGIAETLGAAAAALLPPNNASAIAAAILDLWQRPSAWSDLSHAGRQRVEQHYDQQTWIHRLESLYARVRHSHGVTSST